MLFHMIPAAEMAPWLELGWTDMGPSHLPNWNLIGWDARGKPVAPFSAYLAHDPWAGRHVKQFSEAKPS